MNILHLKYAVEIAKTKSISQAAANLYMGQPNLSRAVRELEESLGITIFTRTSRGITITPEGEEFLQYARRIIAQVDEVEELYRGGVHAHRQQLSVCVPRASYIAYAFAELARHVDTAQPAEVYYQEANSMTAINNVLRETYNLGIIRYQAAFDRYFKSLFSEKKLESQLISQFSYVLLLSKAHPLAQKETVTPADLTDYIEIAHADPYVPSLSLPDVKKAELSENVDKRIYVFERGSQFLLLERVPTTFMWVSPIPDDLLRKYGLVQKRCTNRKLYKDVLIYRRGYTRSELDNRFIAEVRAARAAYLSPDKED